MVRNAHLATSISEGGWSPFRTILQAQAACAGRHVMAVAAAFTSQDCWGVLPEGSPCPQRIQKALSVRTQVCPRCGLVRDGDEHAARNILRRGTQQSAAGQAPQASTWADAPSVTCAAPGESRGEHVTSSLIL